MASRSRVKHVWKIHLISSVPFTLTSQQYGILLCVVPHQKSKILVNILEIKATPLTKYCFCPTREKCVNLIRAVSSVVNLRAHQNPHLLPFKVAYMD